MTPELVAGAVAIVALVVFRLYAARQVAARRDRFVWAFAFPMVVGPAVSVWVGLGLVSSGQVLFGGFIVVFGAALGAVELTFFRRASRAVSTATSIQELDEALIEPTTDFMLAMTVGSLLFAILGGLGLVVWAVVTQGR